MSRFAVFETESLRPTRNEKVEEQMKALKKPSVWPYVASRSESRLRAFTACIPRSSRGFLPRCHESGSGGSTGRGSGPFCPASFICLGSPFDFLYCEQAIKASLAGTLWEACMTLNTNWGYHAGDNARKASRESWACSRKRPAAPAIC